MKKNREKQTPPSSSALAIVGLGCLFPGAENVGAYWANIRQGIDAITEVPPSHWRPEDYFDADPKSPDKVYARHGGFLSPVDFNPLEYGILPNALEATDTSQLLGLVAVDQALKDAGYGAEKEFDRERVSVILGVTGTLELVIPLGARLGHPRWRVALKEAGVEDAVAEDAMRRISDSYVPWQETSFPGLLGNVVAGRISRHFNFSGTNCVCDAACGSSLSALNLAALELAAGKADMVVTGGIDTFNDIFMYTCFSKTPALSPSGHARSFDAEGDGTTLGEGLGIIVLKRLADAERDGDRIYAVVRGIGSSSDGRGAAIYEPNAAGQEKALRRAYEQAGVTPDSIELVEAHGTGTKVGDAIEIKALRSVFGEADQPWCAIGSVKSQIGHTKAAAGAAGLIKATMALYHKVLPPTIKVKQPLEAVTAGRTPFYVNSEARPWIPRGDHPRRAGVSALGFGGSNFHCLLEEYRRDKPASDATVDMQILAFSGEERGALTAAMNRFPAAAAWSDIRVAAHASRAAFDPRHPCRLLLTLEKKQGNPSEQMRKALALLENNVGEGSWSTPDGVFLSVGAAAGGLAILFPGQGAQYPGMLRDLALHFPEFLNALQEADAAFAVHAGAGQGDLGELIHPRPAFTAEQRSANERRLQATEVAQPALGAVSLGALDVLAAFGVRADAFAGHSYGELTALCAAGRFDRPALHALSRLRGELMAAGAGDRGSMLAVSSPLAEIEKLLGEEGLHLVLANRNTPQQGVLSGATAEIRKAAEILGRKGIACKELSVAAAFHSELVAEASGPFAARLRDVPFADAKIPVFANTTGEAYPASADAARQLLANQLARPVAFVDEIQNLYASGVRTFLEAGPGGRLTGMVRAILADQEHQALAVDASAGKRSGVLDLARTLAQLAALGHAVDLRGWDAEAAALANRPEKKKPGMTVPISGANHFQPPPKRPPVAKKAGEAAVKAPEAVGGMANMGDAPHAPAAPAGNLQEALRLTQQSMQALQTLQEQTAQLHQKFLEGQELAGRTVLGLIEQQRQLFQGGVPSAPRPVVGASSFPAEAPHPAPALASSTSAAPALAATFAEPAAAPDRVPSQPATDGKVAEVLLAVIAEKTGYPVEMLDLDMALDADLGIDSIKRVEILSAVQEQLPAAPVIRPEHLGVLQTLGQIVEHLGDGQPATVGAPAAAPVAGERIAEVLLAVIAEKTGYPVEMLDLDMALDTDMGIDSIKRVEILSAVQEQLPEAPAIRPEHLGVLQTLGQIVAHLGAGSAQQAAAASPASLPLAGGRIAAVLLAVIAEKTGYPVEMLELEMALDTDLGIDSIKRVEILSAVQEQLPEAPAVRPEHLGTLQTLGQIVDFLAAGGRRPEPPAEPEKPTAAPLARDTVARTLLAVIAAKTGYPVEMLELDMALDADLGIDSIKRVEILSALQEELPGAPAVRPEHLGTLQTVRQIVDFLASVTGAGPSPAAETAVDSAPRAACIDRKLLKVAPLQGRGDRPALELPAGATIWVGDDGSALAGDICAALTARRLNPVRIDPAQLDALAPPAELVGLILLTPEAGTSDASLQQAFRLLQLAGPGLCAAAASGTALLAGIARLNGCFGLPPGEEPGDPLSGGLAGLVKTAALEWPKLHCKALDLAADAGEGSAETIVAELLLDGPLEVGVSARGLHTLKLTDAPLAGEALPLPIAAGDVVVISGGARGVTAEIAVAMAAACRPTLVLLGRTPAPEAEEAAWLTGLTGEGEIKKGVVAQASAPLKPREIEARYRRIVADREIRATLRRIEAAGGVAVYRPVDLRDSLAVEKAFAAVRAAYGPVRGIVHGAGVLADRRIEDKTIEQFAGVYATKVAGLRALLAAAGEDELKFLALFSSSTGRFGRIGQIDYAVANEVLNKWAQLEARRRPDCRVVSLNWGPWDGGMVTPALKKIFAAEGVEIIDLAAGADYLLRELATAPGGPVELVIAGAKAGAHIEGAAPVAANACISKAFDLDLTVEQYPFLRSHVMDKKAVLPMAMIIEWMAHGAIHNNPGLRFHGFNDLRLLKGVTLLEGHRHTLQVMTGKAFKSGGFHVVPVELSGGDGIAQPFVHARAKIVLAGRLPEGKAAAERLELSPYPLDAAQIYRPERLFHGPDFHGIEEVAGCGKEGIAARVKPAPSPADWIAQPLRNSWLADPLALDSSFQMMILWSFERFQAGSLPVFAGRYRQYREVFPAAGCEIRIRVTRQQESKATADIDFVDPADGRLVARIEDYECVIDASLNQSFQRNKLQGAA